MQVIPARELRNNVSAVLRRVEEGERLTVTIQGRPVAELVPLSSKPRSITWTAFTRNWGSWRADPALTRELVDLLPETTDDIPFK
jgi:prevent-host-death family protein